MYVEPGIAYCSERGLELHRLYLLAYRARLELDQGRWAEAADYRRVVLRIPPHVDDAAHRRAGRAGARARAARRPGGVAAAGRGVGVGGANGRAAAHGPVAAARAEAAWLAGRPDMGAAETQAAYKLALEP